MYVPEYVNIRTFMTDSIIRTPIYDMLHQRTTIIDRTKFAETLNWATRARYFRV